MIQLAGVVALTTLVLGLLGAFAMLRVASLRLRLAGVALVASVAPLVALVGSGAVMFEKGHDALLLAAAAAASLAGLVGAGIVARSVLRPIGGLRHATAAMGAGDLTARAPIDGPTELRALGSEFNRMAADVERLFDARRELVAWASHDLRTPLAAMNAMLEAVEDGIAPAERYLPRLREQVAALSGIVDDLLQLSVIDAGALRVEPRDVPIDDIVVATLAAREAGAASRAVALACTTEPVPTLARCAPEHVARVLGNLVDNALSHTPAGGAVAVHVRRRGATVEVAVEDGGPGLDAGVAERIFEPFFRGDAARARLTTGGAGLGLAIARGLVEAQGGSIAAANRPEGGARFTFTLPAADSTASVHRAVALS